MSEQTENSVGEWVVSIHVNDNKVKLLTVNIDCSKNKVLNYSVYLADTKTLNNLKGMNTYYQIGVLSKEIFLMLNRDLKEYVE